MYPYLGTLIFPVYTYGVFLALGFLAGIFLAIFHAPLFKIKVDDVVDLAVWFMITSMVGARILYILLYPQQFPNVISWFQFNKGGLVFFGGFLATVFTVVIFSMLRNLDLRDLGDMIAPSLAVGHVLGRLGCFMNGCCFGKPTESFLGIVFPVLKDGVSRHPTQLYEAAGLLLLLIAGLVGIRKREKWPNVLFPGSIWGYYCVSYGFLRYFVETLRDDDRGGFFTQYSFSISQIISIGIITAGIFWLFFCWKKNRHKKTNDGFQQIST